MKYVYSTEQGVKLISMEEMYVSKQWHDFDFDFMLHGSDNAKLWQLLLCLYLFINWTCWLMWKYLCVYVYILWSESILINSG